MKEDEINADYDEFISLYEEANRNASSVIKKAPAAKKLETSEIAETDKGTGAIVGATPEEQKAIEEAEKAEEATPVRKRKTKEEAVADEVKEMEEKPDVNPAVNTPVRRTRKKREE